MENVTLLSIGSRPFPFSAMISKVSELLRLQAFSDIKVFTCVKTDHGARRPSRWQSSKIWRWPSSPQTHQKYIYMWNNSYRTPTEHWQKTSDFPKCKKLPMYLAMWLTRYCSAARCQAWASDVGEPSSGHSFTRDFPGSRDISRRELSQRSPSQC